MSFPAASGHDTVSHDQEERKSNSGAIVGGVLGGIAIIVLISVLVVLAYHQRRKKVIINDFGYVFADSTGNRMCYCYRWGSNGSHSGFFWLLQCAIGITIT